MSDKIQPQHLARKAVLYVRQSSAFVVLPHWRGPLTVNTGVSASAVATCPAEWRGMRASSAAAMSSLPDLLGRLIRIRKSSIPEAAGLESPAARASRRFMSPAFWSLRVSQFS